MNDGKWERCREGRQTAADRARNFDSPHSMAGEHPEGVFVESTAVSVCPALALSAFYTFFKPVLNLQNSRPIEWPASIQMASLSKVQLSLSPLP